jgi:CheY-like chemotaxis protein
MVEGLNILLSDRDKFFLELCKTYLRKSEMSIFTCQNGKNALDILRKERPRLAVMAAEMTTMNGVDCCKAIKMDESLRTIPVLLNVSSGKREEVKRCSQPGCDDVQSIQECFETYTQAAS